LRYSLSSVIRTVYLEIEQIKLFQVQAELDDHLGKRKTVSLGKMKQYIHFLSSLGPTLGQGRRENYKNVRHYHTHSCIHTYIEKKRGLKTNIRECKTKNKQRLLLEA